MPITDEQIQVAIEHIVRGHYVIKGVDLVLKTIEHLHPILFEREQYEWVLQNMVDRDDIIELEYVTPDVDYRVKSIYFVKGTRFVSISKEEVTNDEE